MVYHIHMVTWYWIKLVDSPYSLFYSTKINIAPTASYTRAKIDWKGNTLRFTDACSRLNLVNGLLSFSNPVRGWILSPTARYNKKKNSETKYNVKQKCGFPTLCVWISWREVLKGIFVFLIIYLLGIPTLRTVDSTYIPTFLLQHRKVPI